MKIKEMSRLNHSKSIKKISPLFLYGITHKFINKFIIDGKKTLVKKIIHKSFCDIKQELNINPKRLLFKILTLCQLEIGFLKYYTKKQSRMKRRKKARYIPTPLAIPKQKTMALSLLTKFILHQKKKRNNHNFKNTIYLLKHKMWSLSKKKTFEDRFYVSHKDQNLHTLIKSKFILWHRTNFNELIKFRFKFYAKATNHRTHIHFRWRFHKRNQPNKLINPFKLQKILRIWNKRVYNK